MLRSFARTFGIMSVVAGALAGCSDCLFGPLARPARHETFFSCKVCLADAAGRCATQARVCGDLPDRVSAEVGARDALCDTLSPAELARRPAPQGFEPSPYLKNACYGWPADAFTSSCTTFTKLCDGVPIH